MLAVMKVGKLALMMVAGTADLKDGSRAGRMVALMVVLMVGMLGWEMRYEVSHTNKQKIQ